MLRHLKIQNFQSHKDSELEFVPGVNVIVGESDKGKSTIVRALKWIITNRPQGNDIVSHWGGDTIAELETMEGQVITRCKKKSKDLYKLGEAEFKAIRSDVPKEIADALNITEVNLQQQLDSHFLLSKSSGEVASYLNKVSKLDQIDLGTQNINSSIRTLTSTIKYKKKDLISERQKLEKFEGLDFVESKIEVLEELEERARMLRSQRTSIMNMINSIELTSIEVRKVSRVLTVERKVDAILQLYKTKRNLEQRKMLLSKATSDLVRVNVLLKDNEAKHTRLLAQFKEVFPEDCPLCGAEKKYQKIK
jgi:exonuclease SbcC